MARFDMYYYCLKLFESTEFKNNTFSNIINVKVSKKCVQYIMTAIRQSEHDSGCQCQVQFHVVTSRCMIFANLDKKKNALFAIT